MNILVVEDDIACCSFLEWQLGDELGNKITAVPSVEVAIRVLSAAEIHWHVVITGYYFRLQQGYMRSSLTGEHLLEHLFNHHDRNTPMVIMYSGLDILGHEYLKLQRSYGDRFYFFSRENFGELKALIKSLTRTSVIALRPGLWFSLTKTDETTQTDKKAASIT